MDIIGKRQHMLYPQYFEDKYITTQSLIQHDKKHKRHFIQIHNK